MELLLGCGSNRTKKLAIPGRHAWSGIVTLDMHDGHKPDHVHDLMDLPLPFADNSAEEIHAYDVLEHTGQQGDWKWFFRQWEEFWRILTPGGTFHGISPHWSSPWAWGDPGHTRIIGPECLVYLSQAQYRDQVGRTPMTDYRSYYRGDFEILHNVVNDMKQFEYVLRAIK